MSEQAFHALSIAITDALREIDADPDQEHAYLQATELSLLGRQLLVDAAIARGRALDRLLEERDLVLAELAELIGTSKSRVAQLVTAARKADQEHAALAG